MRIIVTLLLCVLLAGLHIRRAVEVRSGGGSLLKAVFNRLSVFALVGWAGLITYGLMIL